MKLQELEVVYQDNLIILITEDLLLQKNARRRNNRFKTKLALPQGRNVDIKVRGNVARRMRVRGHAIFPAMQRKRQY